MSALIRAKDWSKTTLGDADRWPPSLTLVVNLLLAAGFPMAVRWGWDFVMIYNDAYRPILGDKHPGALGLPFREAWPEVQTQLGPLHEAILSGKRSAFFAEDLPLRIQRHGAEYEDARFTVSYSPVPDASVPTGVGGVLITAVETTNRVLTEKALRSSEERYRSAMTLGRMGSWEVDFVKGIRVWTPEGMALFGINLTDGLGHVGGETDELRQSMHPEDRHLLGLYHTLANTQDSFPAEYRIVKPDGKVSWLSGYGRVLDRQADGKAHRLINVATDITERKQVDAALGESEQRLRWLASIVESSDDAIISKNLDGIITSWNKGAERIFGYTAEEAVHRHISLIIPPDRLQEEADILARLRRGERIDHFETIRRRKDGALLNISVTISPVKDAAGRVTGASKVARDITERKRAEEALRQSEDRFRTLSERLDSEVRARTRELEERNADVVRQSERLRELSWRLLRTQDEERRHIARELHDSAGQTLAVLGMNLSTIVQIAKEKAPDLVQSAQETQELAQQLTKEIRTTSYLLHPPLLDENGLPAALSWYIRGLTERSDFDIAFTISEEFGRLSRGMELVIFRLVQECLTNVHRHSGSKSAAIHIVREPDRILVEVRDRGKGIPPEKLAEIQSSGSGVGISGMRERLRQFHGEMIIQSTAGGTTVLVTIPVPTEEPGIPQGARQTLKPAV